MLKIMIFPSRNIITRENWKKRIVFKMKRGKGEKPGDKRGVSGASLSWIVRM